MGIPPMPNCKQAPLGISSTMSLATVSSTSVGAAPPPISAMGGLLPSTTISTCEMWMPSSKPPRQTGMFVFTSTMTVLEVSQTAARWEALGPKLKYPCSSMGATWMIATSLRFASEKSR